VIDRRRSGSFSFHNGIDIAAWPGNWVYPVVSGHVLSVDGDRVVVGSTHHRRFQYIHIRPYVHVGRWVFASRTLLGFVTRRWNHVHLTEERGECVVNPLARGHLSPYDDDTRPRVLSVVFVAASGRRLAAGGLSGDVRMVADARDEPATPAPGAWRRMPVAPALLTWTLRTTAGTVVAAGIAADFRYSEPPAGQFCSVYAPGTLQNFAADHGIYDWGRAGRFLFELTPRPFDTARLDNGRYLLTVSVRDTSGNSGTLRAVVGIRNTRSSATPIPVSDWRCSNRALLRSTPAALRRSPHRRASGP
jgi:hypothetical protein